MREVCVCVCVCVCVFVCVCAWARAVVVDQTSFSLGCVKAQNNSNESLAVKMSIEMIPIYRVVLQCTQTHEIDAHCVNMGVDEFVVSIA